MNTNLAIHSCNTVHGLQYFARITALNEATTRRDYILCRALCLLATTCGASRAAVKDFAVQFDEPWPQSVGRHWNFTRGVFEYGALPIPQRLAVMTAPFEYAFCWTCVATDAGFVADLQPVAAWDVYMQQLQDFSKRLDARFGPTAQERKAHPNARFVDMGDFDDV